MGHSQGASRAIHRAARPCMGGIVMMAGNARSVLDLIDEQVEYLAGVDGPPSDEAKEEVRKIKQPPRRSAPERPRA